jgi:hypothetical protein
MAFEKLVPMSDTTGHFLSPGRYRLRYELLSEPGARGVGRAAATAVVSCCAAIFFLDFALTPFLARAFGP